jgi:hypothetical protein
MTTPEAQTIEEQARSGRLADIQPPVESSGTEDAAVPLFSDGSNVQVTGERDQQLLRAIDSLTLSPIQRAYLHERWLGQMRYLGQSARRAQRRFYALRMVAILGGVGIPALIGLNFDNNYAELVQWLAFTLGLLVAGAVALEEFFRFGERWRHFRQQSERLRGEGWSFLQRASEGYQRYDSFAEAFRFFVEQVEGIIRQEVGIYITEISRPPGERGTVTDWAAPTVPRTTDPPDLLQEDRPAPLR